MSTPLAGGRHADRSTGPNITQRRMGRIIIWTYAIATLVAVLLWLSRRVFASHLHISWAESFFWIINVPVSPSLVSIAGMALLTLGLIYHKRIALWIVTLMQILGGLWACWAIVAYLVANNPQIEARRGEQLPASIVSAVFAGLAVWTLIRVRQIFPAKVPPGSWAAAIGVLAGGVLVAIGVSALLVHIQPDNDGPAWQQTLFVMLHALGIAPPRDWHSQTSHLVSQGVSLIIALALIAAALIFLRSRPSQDAWHPASALDARRLLANFGGNDSLGYFNTRADKLLHFSDDGKAAVAYRVVAGVCLASGDPLGDPHSWPAAITGWDAEARRYGWIPAVLACSEAGARSFNKVLGYGVLRLGDESVLAPQRFRLDSTSMTEVRKDVNRARRDGLTAEIRRSDELNEKQLDTIAQAADRWREGDERGFSMALGRRPGDPADGKIVVATVHDAAGTMVALQSFVPWGRRGLSLDLMRRSPDAPNGTNEFLTSELMAWCRDHGIERVSLNFAFFRQVFAEAEDVAAPVYRKMNSQVLGMLDRFWQIQSLYRANAKYGPSWSPRYVALASPLTVLQVGLACLIAEGFLHLPFRPGIADHGWLEFTGDQLAELAVIDAPPVPADEPHSRGSDQARQRLIHLEALKAAGRPGYPVGHRDAVRLSELGVGLELATNAGRPIVGRLRRTRNFGGVCFADLTDRSGSIQLLLDAATLGRDQVHQFARLTDSGDLLEVTGEPGRSRNGTPSLLVSNWTMLAKAVRPVPWQGLNDPQTRTRNRSLDLLINPGELDILRARSQAIAAVRQTFLDEGFLEVETPILGTTNGGATARPFRTHINAYDTDLVLRIAPELQLKRLLVPSLDPIFELGRNFRNEGADNTHNPEFTVVEAYLPLADYNDMRLLTQRVIQNAATAIHGRPVLPLPDASGRLVLTDIGGDWPVVDVTSAVSEKLGREVSIHTDTDELIEIARDLGIELKEGMGPGAVLEELYGELVESSTVLPTFYCDFPEESSPLTAPHRTKPGLVERWDLVSNGTELGTAYSELADPMIQRKRLVEQSWRAAQGDPEAMEVDNDFLNALELGMPPTGGLGIGLDRLIMAITGTNIRQVLTFPFVKPIGK
ncbi:bifunctional lysylphosphatidylglycerol synthetase/lysine--tRNA ligase LysX [Propionimicrobium sp. PCR01-08-3]|uniref:bifunctional lysylphosphatidylglycerol synthetase/lysine--tRNA ligase LysX n=1 Tax=Propionimicrobium sp. PCR01-08-3 TaxID=3052086 RepID=UPI00255C96BF|nr:bifunctional lysylphosphatidylglycerol synthetase/lysine--tRNA ligase LysX [Propionimicrobium sp. PCR01-08-3]WIY82822.1 bifunctional lysylphosphatidylglycerol synthetase/lysine--tRNA ligase LysX [Propionimicrobium sp. PCR01-08-3]